MDALNKCVEAGCKTKRPPVRKPLLSGTKILHHQRWIYSMLDSINHRNLSRSRDAEDGDPQVLIKNPPSQRLQEFLQHVS